MERTHWSARLTRALQNCVTDTLLGFEPAADAGRKSPDQAAVMHHGPSRN